MQRCFDRDDDDSINGQILRRNIFFREYPYGYLRCLGMRHRRVISLVITDDLSSINYLSSKIESICSQNANKNDKSSQEKNEDELFFYWMLYHGEI